MEGDVAPNQLVIGAQWPMDWKQPDLLWRAVSHLHFISDKIKLPQEHAPNPILPFGSILHSFKYGSHFIYFIEQ